MYQLWRVKLVGEELAVPGSQLPELVWLGVIMLKVGAGTLRTATLLSTTTIMNKHGTLAAIARVFTS